MQSKHSGEFQYSDKRIHIFQTAPSVSMEV